MISDLSHLPIDQKPFVISRVPYDDETPRLTQADRCILLPIELVRYALGSWHGAADDQRKQGLHTSNGTCATGVPVPLFRDHQLSFATDTLMAQGNVGAVMAGKRGVSGAGASMNGSSMASLTPDEAHEIRQYEKLLRFRDEVVGGSHPRIKPSHLHGKAAAAASGPLPSSVATSSTAPANPQPSSAKAPANGGRSGVDNFQSYQTNLQRPPVKVAANLPGLGTLSSPSGEAPRSFGSGKIEINPVLLEKSDDLIKAEMQLHRQRVERGLREQIEQRRASQKASLQASEQLADFDIADVLQKALAMVQTTTAQPTDDVAANASASSDSFDDNTFYSSQHDTPQSHQISRVRNESEEERMRDASPYEPEFEPEPAVQAHKPQPTAAPSQSTIPGALLQQQPATSTSSPAIDLSQSAKPTASSEATSVSRAFRQLHAHEAASPQDSGVASRSDESVHTGRERATDPRDLARVNAQLLSQALGRSNGSPVVRAHDLSPIAPQPSHISPLAVTRQQPVGLSDTGGRRATPAQVAALRKHTSAASSPESSPQGTRALERKKSKKKKRKADRLAVESAAASPYIKPEPRSPSPLTAAPYARPAKRQKQTQTQQQGLSNDGIRYEQPIAVDDNYPEQYQPRIYREERVVEYGRETEPRSRREAEPLVVAVPRYERVYYEDSRPPPSARQVQPDSPSGQPATSYIRDVRTVAPVSHAFEPPFGDASVYQRDPRAVSRMSVHPTAYREHSQSPIMYERHTPAMGPPKAPQMRIVVDAYGREYFEPRAPVVVREGLVSEHRVPEHELSYGRPSLPRAMSRRPDMFEDDTVAYRQGSPAYPVPRRIVTNPEFAAPEQRAYRERAYPNQIMAPPLDEYIPSRAHLEGSSAVEPSREYITRPASTRPPIESARYGSAAVYDGRTFEERLPPREYYDVRTASVRPGEAVRYELPLGYERRADESLREYPSLRSGSVRPAETTIRYEVAREYGARVGSVRPEMPVRGEYAPSPGGGIHPDGRREMLMQPPPVAGGRAYSVHPNEAAPSQQQQQVMRHESSVGPGQLGERYYGRPPPPPPQQQPPSQDDEDVVFLDRPPQGGMYRELR
ncbi:hypothetical protein B0T17DRAFT_506320 [Bombardia bombarda]|uniref:Uncharacterized protein n=1 Tax=Bombardia bombarda TaxID=252184 RepID=A0AA40C973_9PEZI|nr:hypothetical protein B0T17DRAFT_506320 [Bombardia bombarda]